MKERFKMWEVVPQLYKHLASLDQSVVGSGIDRGLLELIKIRASQINRCAYCIDIHTDKAIKDGEKPRRIFALNAWKESTLFSDAEKVVLQLTEEVTLIHIHGLSHTTYEKLQKYYSIETIAKLIIAVTMINTWNRTAISTLMTNSE
ncbi:carboxymuconolactone decarboxylase family protein [Sphingobacterium multivorum]|uniref:carboxymuconolactone decarboxylase family protein n=1 Tax=Sphingobacterium multivorum TaxID=28454 RepID=UPI003678445D